MATDSIVLEENRGRFSYRNSIKHLHKGHGIVAASSSIPSKFQTIVLDNSDNKGFLSRAKRFQSLEPLNENPGPGTYRAPEHDINTISPSYSTQGTGTFASKNTRFPVKKRVFAQPGPGEYEPSKPPIKIDFNRANVTSNFHLPIAVHINERKQLQAPAPNSYKVSKATGKVVHDNNVTACAAFKSNSKRETLSANKKNLPSPCQYNVNDVLLQKNSSAATASFKSTTERKVTQTSEHAPGPGSYNPYKACSDPKKGYKFCRRHYLSISAPALEVPELDPSPGPGHYNLVNYKGEEKRYMSSSMFVSTTSRWKPGTDIETEIPGPTSYRPRRIGKQSFIYNPSRKWIT
ncbi:O(6)-methylguanine-induced apoptosis 2-like [Xenia sp. Carnegie-2017]|uniref:O(6)-methylguanine-induced apoptosis 2-like n=1 Tax=Xenia sp. Carnegie-2017 TaxID=2897299 RepID=UPI001F036AEE|nr:O(6)-methylguanine-induced apoptosis 2-like [Xenia sp. Carnegie-2017]XP_046846676.1 O(6)-methylguanine-induced apoptosis 2-like [Xenia sp. Carnegie-2017]